MESAIQSTVRRLLEAAALFDDEDAPRFAPPASPSELDDLAAAANVDLPDEFIEFLSLHRAIVAMNIRNGYWIGASASGPVVLAQGPSTATCGAARLPVFPVASDGGGNLFLRPLTMSSIWRWDHETGVTHRVAEDLAEFLRIVAEDWGHAARGDEAHAYLVSSARYRRPAFVQHVQAVYGRGRREDMDEPGWDVLAQILARLGTAGGACRLDLFNEDESVAMTIYGENNNFHVGIIRNETDQTYLAAGPRGSGSRVDIAGHSSPEHLVVNERQRVIDVAQNFWRDGTVLASAQWTNAW